MSTTEATTGHITAEQILAWMDAEQMTTGTVVFPPGADLPRIEYNEGAKLFVVAEGRPPVPCFTAVSAAAEYNAAIDAQQVADAIITTPDADDCGHSPFDYCECLPQPGDTYADGLHAAMGILRALEAKQPAGSAAWMELYSARSEIMAVWLEAVMKGVRA